MSDHPPDATVEATQWEFTGGQKIFGRYTLVRILGQGGMGVVWLARDEELERDVALKFLPQAMVHDRTLLDSLKRETRRSLELTHKNIVRIYDFEHDERTACISMEYVDGETLSNRRAEKEQGVFEPNELSPWTSQLCEALDYAHNHARVIHRDLKPANLMVNRRGELKVSDFGIARSLSDTVSRLTAEQGRSGTLVYMSPQQLEGKRGTHLDDIYSLGATLYDLLTSKPPFYSGNIDRQIHERVPPSMTERRKELNIEPASVPAIWEQVVAACLQKDPAKRPQSAIEVAHRLQLPSVPIPARVVSRAGPSKAVLWAGAAVLICLIGLGTWYFAKSKPHANVAPTALGQAAAISDKSIAVVPFENLSEDKANAYFATGIQNEILTRLAKIGALKVISRLSTQQYPSRPENIRDIANQLGVANILEGSVQKAADQVHINVQLIRVATDEHLWGESYDRKLENIFGVEAEVATAVAEALEAKLTGAEKHALEQKPTNNPDAYQAYLRGIAFWNELNSADETKAKQEFEDAVALDPNFALAWALLARVNSDFYFLGADSGGRAGAQKALENAVRLQPNLPEVQLAQACYQFLVLRDHENARAIFERLLATLPNDADVRSYLSLITQSQGRWSESRAYAERGIELNPRDRGSRSMAAFVREATRDFNGALRCYDEALSIWPDNAYFIAGKASIYQSLGELDLADELLKGLHITPRYDAAGLGVVCNQAKFRRSYSQTISLLRSLLDQANSFAEPTREDFRRMLADLLRLSGDASNAKASYLQVADALQQRLKDRPDDDGISANLARVYAGLGDAQLAMKYADRAVSLLPASKDAFAGPWYEEVRGRIAAHFGMNDLAIPALERLLKTMYQDPITPAILRLDPDFDPLRGDPRFEKLAHSDGK